MPRKRKSKVEESSRNLSKNNEKPNACSDVNERMSSTLHPALRSPRTTRDKEWERRLLLHLAALRSKKSPASFKQSGKMDKEGSEGNVIKNLFTVADGSNPVELLRHLQEMFKESLEPDVVSLIFNECDCNVETALEVLVSLSTEMDGKPGVPLRRNRSVPGPPAHEAKSRGMARADACPSPRQNYSQRPKKANDNQMNLHFEFPAHFPPEPNAPKSFCDSLIMPNWPNNISYTNSVLNGQATNSKTIQMGSAKGSSKSNQSGHNKSARGHGHSNVSEKHYGGTARNMSPLAFVSMPQRTFNVCSTTSHKISLSKHVKGDQPLLNDPVRLQHFCTFPSPNTIAQRVPYTGQDTPNVQYIKQAIISGKKVLIILRGLPGSGKSTFARQLKFGGMVLSTDDYFMKNGRYTFDWNKLSEAHDWNKSRAKNCMIKGVTPIIIDNTNTEAWEIKPYISLGLTYIYEIHLLEPPTPWKFNIMELAKRNIHGVPKEKLSQMLQRYERNVTVDNILKTMSAPSFSQAQNMRPQPSHMDKTSGSLHHWKTVVNKEIDKSVGDDKKKKNKKKRFKGRTRKRRKKPVDSEEKTAGSSLDNNTESQSLLCGLSDLLSIRESATNCITSLKRETKSKVNDSKGDDTSRNITLDELRELHRQGSETSVKIVSVKKESNTDSCDWEPVDDFQWSEDKTDSSDGKTVKNSVSDTIQEDDEELDDDDDDEGCESSSESTISEEDQEDSDEDSESEEDITDVEEESSSDNTSLKMNLAGESVDESISSTTENCDVFSSSSSIESIDTDNNLEFLIQNCNADVSALEENDTLITLNEPNADNSSVSHDVNVNNYSLLPDFTTPEANELETSRVDHDTIHHSPSYMLLDSGVPDLADHQIVYGNILDSNSYGNILDSNSWDNAIEVPCPISPSKSNEQHVPKKPREKTIDRFTNLGGHRNEVAIEVSKIGNGNKLNLCDKADCDSSAWESWVDTPDTEQAALSWKALDSGSKQVEMLTEQVPKPQRASRSTSLSLLPEDEAKDEVVSFLSEELQSNLKEEVKLEEESEMQKDKQVAEIITLLPMMSFDNGLEIAANTDDNADVTKTDRNLENQAKPPRKSKMAAKLDALTLTKSPSSILSSSDLQVPVTLKETASHENAGTVEVSTQTESSDFITCEQLIQDSSLIVFPFRVIQVSLHAWIESLDENTNTAEDNALIPTVPKYPLTLEKGTTTDGIPDSLSASEKVEFLKSCFPEISDEDLGDIYEKCHNDVNWAVNILLDFGYDYNAKEEDKTQDEIEQERENASENITDATCPGNIPSVSNALVVNDFDQVCHADNTQIIPSPTNTIEEKYEPEVKALPFSKIGETSSVASKNQQRSNDDSAYPQTTNGNVEKSLKLMLTLDRAFALQLEELFGPVGFHISPGAHTDSHLTVMIGMDLARKIHDQWAATHQEMIEEEEIAMESMIMTDNDLQQSCGESPHLPCEPQVSGWSEEFPSLTEAVQYQAHPCEKTDKHKVAIAKLNSLKEIFPDVEESILEDVLISNDYFLPRAVEVIEEALGFRYMETLSEKALQYSEKSFSRVARKGDMQKTSIEATDPTEDALSDSSSLGNDFELSSSSGYEDFRAEATLHYRLRQECFQKAQEAYRKGMKAVASFYSQQGHLHSEKLRWANKRAADKILQWRNASTGPNILDLHGLHVQEAVEALEKFLERKQIELRHSPHQKFLLYVITGRGRHSAYGMAKLRPAILSHLEKYNFRSEEIYKGTIKVVLT